MTLKIMDSPPVVGNPAIAHLCDDILETLRSFGNAAADFTAFRGEVRILRKFLDLIERIRTAKEPRTPFEEEHFSDLETLLERCRSTLSRLCEILAELKARYQRAAPQDALQQALRSMQDSETVALRGRIGFYIQSLQMSLQTVKLVYQWKSQLPQDGIFFHHKDLAEAVQLLKDSVKRRKGMTQKTTQHSPVEEEAFLYDVEKCLFSAEVIMSITATTVYENVASPFPLMASELPGTPADKAPMEPRIPEKSIQRNPELPRLDMPRFEIHKAGDRTPDPESQSSSRGPSPVPPFRKPANSKHITTAIRPKASKTQLKEPQTKETQLKRPMEKPIMFHLDDINAKHRGSLNFESDCDSIFDPEPEFEDRFPDAVYSELITGLQKDVQLAMSLGDYQKAEQCHRKAMEYFADREKKLHLPFDNKADMQETLAEIYVQQKQLSKAKQILNRLLTHEKDDTPRKWRLYYALADVYLEQDRLTEAEKFAKRAYIGREKSLAKDDPVLLESVSLLVKVYERQHKTETAEALKRVYRAESSIPPQVPPKSRQRDRGASLTSPQSPPQSPPQYQPPFHPPYHPTSPPYPHSPTQPPPPRSPINPFDDSKVSLGSTHVRWAPDVWVDSSSINAPTKSGETPLIAAINTGDEELVQLMLSRGADLEARCVDQITPLMHATKSGHHSIVEFLLSRGVSVEATTAGWTALHKAADMVNIPIAKTLLSHGADMEARSPKDFTPGNKHPLARMGSNDLLDDYDQVSSSEADIGWTALLRAATAGQEAMVRLLVDGGAFIEARSPSSGTPLHCACEGNHEAIVDFLLMRGADVNASDEFGWKPLHRALVSRGGERVVQMLLTHGAPLDARCNYRKTPLHHAIEKGNEPMVSFLLSAGADYEARDSAERTPLHTAIESRLENMVRILLEAGADADAKERGGRDALAAANHALRRSPEIIALLSKHKKDKKAKRGSVGSRQTSISRGSVSRSSSASTWWSMKGKKDKKGRTASGSGV